MPLAVNNLTPESPTQLVREALNQSIQQCMQEGKSQEECAAMSYSIARERTGKELGKEA